MKKRNLFSDHNAQLITFVHHKGGTGKTTACLNIAGWLHKLKQRVLVIDLDPQGNASAGLGIDLKSINTSLSDVLMGREKVEDAIFETDSGIYLIPAKLDLLNVEIFFANQSNSKTFLKEKINHLKQHFDFILIDPPPGSGLLMINSIVAAKNIIIPLDSGVFSYETLETLKKILLDIQKNLNIEISIRMALLRNFSSSIFDIGYNQNIRKWVKDFFSTHEITCKICTIPFSRKISQAQCMGIPISNYAPFARVARVYRRIAKEIIGG